MDAFTTLDAIPPVRASRCGRRGSAKTAPGEYILRLEGNDSTGSGGGGFQCCWTNAHVSVTVKPATGTGG